MAVAQEISSLYPNIFLTSSPDIAFEALSQAIIELIVPLAILIIVALIVFVIFLFLQSLRLLFSLREKTARGGNPAASRQGVDL